MWCLARKPGGSADDGAVESRSFVKFGFALSKEPGQQEFLRAHLKSGSRPSPTVPTSQKLDSGQGIDADHQWVQEQDHRRHHQGEQQPPEPDFSENKAITT
jgi:hypothetical protein